MYDEILNILRQEGIEKRSDLLQLECPKERFVYSSRHPWAESIFEIVESQYLPLLNQWKCSSDLYILAAAYQHDLPLPFLSTIGMLPEQASKIVKFERADTNFNTKGLNIFARYSCVFPGQIVYMSRPFLEGSKDQSPVYAIPLEFLYLLLLLAPMLKSKLAFLVPLNLPPHSTKGEHKSKLNVPEFLKPSRQWSVSAFFSPLLEESSTSLSQTIEEQHTPRGSIQALKMPYLRGVEFNRYVELIKKYPKEFNLYNTLLVKALNKPEASEDEIKEWLREANYRVEKINKHHEKKKHELQSKGVHVGIGTLFTVGSIFLPGIGEIISGLLGRKTISDGINWILDYKKLDQTMSEDDFWLLWKLKNYRGNEE